MTDNILFPILMLVIASFTIVFIVFIVKQIKANRSKLNTLSVAQKKTEEFTEKCAADLSLILSNFYGEKSNHYLKGIKKQHQLFCNQIISLTMEYKPNIADKLTAALELLNESYVNSFYEASQSFGTANNQSQKSESDNQLKQTLLMVAQLCNQELDETSLNDPNSIQKVKDSIETVFLENKTQADELLQQTDLIEQLRQEKRDMRQTINQLLTLVEAIYQKYHEELKLVKNASFKKHNDELFMKVFKLDELTNDMSEENNN